LTRKKSDQTAPSAPLAAALAWVVPGLGHWWIGDRPRALIYFIVISTTFWGGVAVAGVRTTVNLSENGAWIAAQLCVGPQAFLALQLSNGFAKKPLEQQHKALWPAANIGVVYAGVAGLLNLLVIIDVLARCEAIQAALAARPPPRHRTG